VAMGDAVALVSAEAAGAVMAGEATGSAIDGGTVETEEEGVVVSLPWQPDTESDAKAIAITSQRVISQRYHCLSFRAK